MEVTTRLEALPAAALACDAAGWVTAVNGRCAALFAGDATRLRGSALSTLFPNERDVQARLLRAAGDSIHLRGRRLTGATVDVEAEAAVSTDGSLTLRVWDVLGAAQIPELHAPRTSAAAGSPERTAPSM